MRRRQLSTSISIDGRVAALAARAGALGALLYTWMIPHAEDDGSLTGDALELRLLVVPGIDCQPSDIERAIDAMLELGLLQRRGDGRLQFPAASWYRYQTYIPRAKRPGRPEADPDEAAAAPTTTEGSATGEDHRKPPQNTEDHRKPPQNTASLSPSLSLSLNDPAANAAGSPPASAAARATPPLVTRPDPDRLLPSRRQARQVLEIEAGKLLVEYGQEWYDAALQVMLLRGREPTNVKYLAGILARWKQTGLARPWEAERQQEVGGGTGAARADGARGRESEYDRGRIVIDLQ